jgi:hypothetical protein
MIEKSIPEPQDSNPFTSGTPDVDGELRVWRYMDFAKFADLLLTSRLWFNRIDRYEDPLEGTLPPGFQRYFASGLTPEEAEAFRKTQTQGHDFFRRQWIYTSCWHARPDESYAFWRIYAAGGAGVAIVSRVERLRSAFQEHQPRVRQVEYIDFDDDAADYRRFHQTDRAFYHKHHVYDYEREVRAIIQLPTERDAIDGAPGEFRLRESPAGISAPVALGGLIESVFVSPYAQRWFADAVRLLCEKTELDVPVTQSSIRVAL